MLLATALLAGCHGTPRQAKPDQPSGPRAIGEDRLLDRALLDAEFRTLLEIQDSFRMMLHMGNESVFGDRRILWTDKQSAVGDQLSVDIVGLLARYTLENTVRANHPVPMDPVLFGREVGRIGERRAALWLNLVETNDLPESTKSIFHNGLYPPRE